MSESLPKAVLDDIAEIAALEKELSPGKTDGNDGIKIEEEVQPVPEPKAEAPQPEPKAEPEIKDDPDALHAPSSDKEQDANYWKSRANTINGMLRKEKERADAELRKLNESIAALQQQMQGMARPEQRHAEPPRQTQAPKELTRDDLLQYFSKEYLDEFGETHAKAQLQAQQKLVEQRVREVESKVSSNLTEVQEQARVSAFWGEISRQVPDAVEVNKDPKFIAWLQQEVPLTGKTRYDFAIDAMQSGKADRVVQMFKAFKAEVEAPTPAAAPKAEVSEAVKAQVTPKPAPAPAAPASKKPVYTEAQVDKFYRDLERGKVSAEEAAKIERQIEQAYKEGRVVRA